ncbi:hypothetical protein ACH5RR_003189 [Cinchona calisaya]|uniref:Uncharacterized protein n=1 Tax=Cinchona calisaya TaxID=153742 RepID=A0ABD3AU39_9GENT
MFLGKLLLGRISASLFLVLRSGFTLWLGSKGIPLGIEASVLWDVNTEPKEWHYIGVVGHSGIGPFGRDGEHDYDKEDDEMSGHLAVDDLLQKAICRRQAPSLPMVSSTLEA